MINFFSGKKQKDKTEIILGKYLDSDFIVFPMAEKNLKNNEIAELEGKIKIKISEDYKAHLLGRFPGIYIEVREEIWPRAQAYDVGPFWSFLYGLHTFTASNQSDDWMRIDYNHLQIKEITGRNVLPILKVVGDADLYCIDEEKKLVKYSHEMNEFEVVNFNFWELFEHEISELKNRKDKKINT